MNYQTAAAHFNHNLRSDADRDANLVKQYARRQGIPYFPGSEDVRVFADDNALTIEEAARHLRYEFLFRTARNWGADAVVVGHTANDQVETVLMNLIRGSGLKGLSGMPYRWLPNPWSDRIPLVRPLLDVWKEDITEYCQMKGLSPVIDPTNQDMGFFRNRIRGELLPLLEDYVPGAKRRIWQTARITAGDHESLVDCVDKYWQELAIEREDDWVCFSRNQFRGMPTGVQRRLIRRMLDDLQPTRGDWGFQIVEEVRKFLTHPPARRDSSLAGGVKIRMMKDRIFIYLDEDQLPLHYWPQLPDKRIRELPIPGHMDLPAGWKLSSREVDPCAFPGEVDHTQEPYQAWLDMGEMCLPLEVRPRRTGERFTPLGMAGQSMKVSDVMSNQKIPRQVRDMWPLITSDDQVVWIPGCRQSHRGQITGTARRVVHLVLEKSYCGG